jgi:hypothetical protein
VSALNYANVGIALVIVGIVWAVAGIIAGATHVVTVAGLVASFGVVLTAATVDEGGES